MQRSGSRALKVRLRCQTLSKGAKHDGRRLSPSCVDDAELALSEAGWDRQAASSLLPAASICGDALRRLLRCDYVPVQLHLDILVARPCVRPPARPLARSLARVVLAAAAIIGRRRRPLHWQSRAARAARR
jgi:hypothetical protein